jgi:hypothetical protein
MFIPGIHVPSMVHCDEEFAMMGNVQNVVFHVTPFALYCY